MEKLYTCEQAAQRYSVKVETVWSWIREGRMEAIKIGRCYRITESGMKKFENGSIELNIERG